MTSNDIVTDIPFFGALQTPAIPNHASGCHASGSCEGFNMAVPSQWLDCYHDSSRARKCSASGVRRWLSGLKPSSASPLHHSKSVGSADHPQRRGHYSRTTLLKRRPKTSGCSGASMPVVRRSKTLRPRMVTSRRWVWELRSS